MFVITADQVDSRHDRDRAGEMIAALTAHQGAAFALPPDQTSGDEIQVLVADAATALDVILDLHRAGHWSIGLGIGTVRAPLPESTRQASGAAFIAARSAVTRAKRADARFALECAVDEPAGVAASHLAPTVPGDAARNPAVLNAVELESLVALLLLLRQRRTPAGWAAVDLLNQGLSQVDIAARLGISTAAVSQRVRGALWRVDTAARPALVRLLENVERATTATMTETDPAE
jgi:DNA-binding CsgD family transcriptional regulator